MTPQHGHRRPSAAQPAARTAALTTGERAILNIIEVLVAAAAFIAGSTWGVLGAFVAGMGFLWAWMAVEEWADGRGIIRNTLDHQVAVPVVGNDATRRSARTGAGLDAGASTPSDLKG